MASGSLQALAWYVVGGLVVLATAYWSSRVGTSAVGSVAVIGRDGGARATFVSAARGGAAVGLGLAGLVVALIAMISLIGEGAMSHQAWAVALASATLGVSLAQVITRGAAGVFAKAVDMASPDEPQRSRRLLADGVGDTVRGVIGAGGDLLESSVGALAAILIYASLAFAGHDSAAVLLAYPLAVAAVGTLASIVGVVVGSSGGRSSDLELNIGIWVTLGLTAAGSALVAFVLFDGGASTWIGLWLAVTAGMVACWGVSELAGQTTSDRSKTVKEVARQSQHGAGALILAGVAEGLRSAVVSAVVILAGVGAAFYLGDWALGAGGGLYGIALAALGAAAPVGMRMAVQAFGSITDSATTIASLAGLPDGERATAVELNASGDATKAATRGNAIGSAILTGFALYAAYSVTAGSPDLEVSRPGVAAGLAVGVMVPFMVAALTLRAVSRTRSRVSLLGGEPGGNTSGGPESIVAIGSRASVRQSAPATVLLLAIPTAAWFLDVEVLAGVVASTVVTGFLLAVFAANAGGALATTRKFLEAGAFGGPGGAAHQAALVGDAVGDPLKDAMVPALNMAIKVPPLVALVLASGVLG